jgi:hypothetical protein
VFVGINCLHGLCLRSIGCRIFLSRVPNLGAGPIIQFFIESLLCTSLPCSYAGLWWCWWYRRFDIRPACVCHNTLILLRYDSNNTILHAFQPLVQHCHVIGTRRCLPRCDLVNTWYTRPQTVFACWFLARASDLLSPTSNACQRQAFPLLPCFCFQLAPCRYCMGVVRLSTLIVSKGMLVRHIVAIVRSGIFPESFTRVVAMSSLARSVRTVKGSITTYALSVKSSIRTWRLILCCVVGSPCYVRCVKRSIVCAAIVVHWKVRSVVGQC